MPELPEVEHMTRGLQRWLAGARLRAVSALDPALMAQGDPATLVGEVVRRCTRRAKYSVVHTSGPALVLHYRMTGKALPAALGGDRAARLRLGVADRDDVLFVDPRRLGKAWVVPESGLAAFFEARGLGPDVWPAPRDADWWAARLGAARGAIKGALLDQGRVAGVGNIGACESLWRARIDPRAVPRDLAPAAWSALAAAVPAWIDATLAAETAPEIHYVTQGGPNPFTVYRREGQPCLRCGAPLASFRQAGRGTTWCPACQTVGRATGAA